MKVKVITCSKYSLERVMAEWLITGDYEVTHMTQSMDDTDICVTMLYMDLADRRDKKIESVLQK